MRKFTIGAMILALTVMLSGCQFLTKLSADVTIENNTSKTFYYMVSYNSSLDLNASKKTLLPGDKVTETLQGNLTGAGLADTTELFGFYMMEDDEYNAYINNNHGSSDWYVIVQKGHAYEAEDKRSQNYKVVINPSSSGYTVDLSW